MRVQLTRTAAAVAVALAVPGSALADFEEREGGYLLHYFADSDHVHVFAHYTEYQTPVGKAGDLAVHWNHEVVVIPAIDAPPGSDEALDAITSASRPISGQHGAYENFTKHRNEVQGDLRARYGMVGYYVSSETDYFAQQVKGSANRDLLGGMLNLSVGSSYGWDRIDPLEDDDTAGGADRKSTLHWDIVATQIATSTTTLRIGAEANIVNGLQHSPYRNVYAAGQNVPERHPDERLRRDLYVKLNQYLTSRASVKLNYTFYNDDWGVRSHTAGAGLSQYITESVIVGYRYRYYDQGAASFYREEYDDLDGIDGYRTGDYRLSAFTAHLMGTELEWKLGNVLTGISVPASVALRLRYERYFNSDNFSANIFESGFGVSF